MHVNILRGGALALVLAACGGDQTEVDTMEPPPVTQPTTGAPPAAPAGSSARAVLRDAQGAEVGTAQLTQQGAVVQIAVDLRSLPPGTHAIHLHAVGSCEAPGFDSAGGHFNPTDSSHGTESPDGPHAGDLPNIEVGDDGTVRETLTNEMITLEQGAPTSIFDADGTAVVVHADPDDNTSQPSGNAGARIACGVIEAA